MLNTYQSQDIADQVSFDIKVTRIKFLSSTLKNKFTVFRLASNLFNHNKIFRIKL